MDLHKNGRGACTEGLKGAKEVFHPAPAIGVGNTVSFLSGVGGEAPADFGFSIFKEYFVGVYYAAAFALLNNLNCQSGLAYSWLRRGLFSSNRGLNEPSEPINTGLHVL